MLIQHSIKIKLNYIKNKIQWRETQSKEVRKKPESNIT